MNIIQIASPHRSARQNHQILMIVNHTMQGTLNGTASWLRNSTSRVSYHYGIGRNGEIHQYVQNNMAAWHSGVVRSPSAKLPHPSNINPNLYTIGVAWEGRAGEPITEAQYQSGLALHRRLLGETVAQTLPIRQRIVGHSQIHSGKPNCPGLSFPWERLYKDLETPVRRVKGPRILIENEEIPITMITGRSFAPARQLLEALNYAVSWDEETQTVTASKSNSAH